jgi:hypothetical protein
MANPLVDQGVLSRLLASIVIPNFPNLNITSPFLGKDGIRLQLEGDAVTYLPTMTGGVISQEPYQICTVRAALLKSQTFADQWKQQYEKNGALGDLGVIPDAPTLGQYQLTNCSISGLEGLDFNGSSAEWIVMIKGYYNINSNLYG